MELFDVIIIGGGPAGMSAALILARSRRKVILFDTAKQRNRMAHSLHGYLTRDGISPKKFIGLARKELLSYNIIIHEKEIAAAWKSPDGHFISEDCDGTQYHAKKLLLATGVQDLLPEVPGIELFYGVSIHHCPYCDGWESRDKRIIAYGTGKRGFAIAASLLNWSADVTLCTGGPHKLNPSHLEELQSRNVAVITSRIKELKGVQGRLKSIEFENGHSITADALFFSNGYKQNCDIAEKLNCRITSKNDIWVNHTQQSSISGCYVSGDAAHEMKLVIIAAGEGAKAGVAINVELMQEETRLRYRQGRIV